VTPTPQQDTAPLRTGEIHAKDDLTRGWNTVDLLTAPGKPNSRYMIGFAASDRCVELVQRLRFEVFNLELKEGLPGSYAEGLDRNDFDPQMTHLVQIERATGRAIGTYRLQTMRHGLAHKGIYSAQEYHFDQIEPLFDETVECGRACLAKGHRNLTTLLLLWSGISAFLRLHSQCWLFGCCSLTTRWTPMTAGGP